MAHSHRIICGDPNSTCLAVDAGRGFRCFYSECGSRKSSTLRGAGGSAEEAGSGDTSLAAPWKGITRGLYRHLWDMQTRDIGGHEIYARHGTCDTADLLRNLDLSIGSAHRPVGNSGGGSFLC